MAVRIVGYILFAAVTGLLIYSKVRAAKEAESHRERKNGIQGSLTKID